ncbi:MAG: AarF/UbiB family protein [Halioglobus sp.]
MANPGVSKSIDSDIDNMAMLIRMSRVLPKGLNIDGSIDGEPLEALGEKGVSQEERNAVGKAMQGLMFRELFEFRTMQSDPNFANYRYQPDSGKIVLLDFGNSDLFSRARDIGMDMYLSGQQQHVVVPPAETTFFHRKLMGSYLSCSRIKAKINVQNLIQPYLKEAPLAEVPI